VQHHCRACGNLFCAACVQNRLALPHLGYKKPVLVCEQCFGAQTILAKQHDMATKRLAFARIKSTQPIDLARLPSPPLPARSLSRALEK
jgi:hypothetical protein